MYEEFTGEDRKIIGEALTQFEAILNKQDKAMIAHSILTKIIHLFLFHLKLLLILF